MKFRLSPANLEIFRFAFYVSFPIGFMLYIGTNTHKKLNVNNFWPDPATLNNPPKDPVEIKREVERLRQERLNKRKRLEEKARQLGVEEPQGNQH
jgi:protein PET100, fungi type